MTSINSVFNGKIVVELSDWESYNKDNEKTWAGKSFGFEIEAPIGLSIPGEKEDVKTYTELTFSKLYKKTSDKLLNYQNMKKLIIIFSLIMLTACISKNTENIEQEYGVLNQTFSQLKPTSSLYRDEFFYSDNFIFSKNQKEFIKSYLFSKNIDTNNLDFRRLELLMIKDSLREIRHPKYGSKSKKKLDINKINRKTPIIIVSETDTLFKDRSVFRSKIKLSRVLFNRQHTRAIYKILAFDNYAKAYHSFVIYSNFKNGAWYIYKAERLNVLTEEDLFY